VQVLLVLQSPGHELWLLTIYISLGSNLFYLKRRASLADDYVVVWRRDTVPECKDRVVVRKLVTASDEVAGYRQFRSEFDRADSYI
jgi:hypothetical protein